MKREAWEREREEAKKRMMEDLEIGYLDEDIIDVLELFFKTDYVFTKSSCSGRITIVDAPYPWSRENSTIVFKSHSGISLKDLEDVLKRNVIHVLWLNVQGPIIHAIAVDLSSALKVLEIARKAGFKHSGILSISERGVVIELTTGVRVNIPIKKKDKILVKEFNEIVNVANEILLEGKKRLKRLKITMEEILKND